MSDDILSQDEIDALLGKSGMAPEPEPVSAAATGFVEDVVHAAMERTATAFGIMSGVEGKAVRDEVATVPLRELHPALRGPHVLVEGEFRGGLDGIALAMVPLGSALAMAAFARGEDPAAPAGDDLTGFRDVAVEMVGHLAEAISAALNREVHVDAAEPIRVEWDYLETPPVPVSLEEEVLYARYVIEVGAVSYDVALMIPGDVVAAILFAHEGGDPAPAAAGTAKETPVAAPEAVATGVRRQEGEARGRSHAGAHVSAASFAELAPARQSTPAGNIDLLLDVPLEVTVELGRTRMQIRELLELGRGSIVELDKVAGEPVEIYVNGKLIAKGEVVTIDENFGVKITDIVSRRERVTNLQ